MNMHTQILPSVETIEDPQMLRNTQLLQSHSHITRKRKKDTHTHTHRVYFKDFLDSTTLLSPPLPLEVGPLSPARGLGERCKLPQRGLRRSRSRILDFGAF